MIEIRWHGRGGQGAFTAAKILGAAALQEGKYALSFPSFGPERRGAPVLAYTKIDDKPIQNRSEVKKCDFILFLDETLYSPDYRGDLKADGKILINSGLAFADNDSVIAVDALSMAEEILHIPITNTGMLGALLGASELLSMASVENAVHRYLNERIALKNIAVIAKARQAVKENLQ